jgi:hypothetical protein
MSATLDVGIHTLFNSDGAGSVLLSAAGIGAGRFLSLGHNATSLGEFVLAPSSPGLGGMASVTVVGDGYLTLWKTEHQPSNPGFPPLWGIATLMIDKSGHPTGELEDLDPSLNVTVTSIASAGVGAVLGVSPDPMESTLGWPAIWGRPIDQHGKVSGDWSKLLDADHAVSFALVEGFDEFAWLTSRVGPTHDAQSVTAQASLTGAKLALAKAPTTTGAEVAKATATGTLFVWLRPRQVGSGDEFVYPIEAAFVSAQGEISYPCD